MAPTAPLPTRVVALDRARAIHGDFPDRFLPSLWRCDPLADTVAAELAALSSRESRLLLDRALREGIGALPQEARSEALEQLFEQLDHVPAWVDWALLERAGELLFRAGPAGGMVLGARSLALSYCSPGGNKPLVISGGLASEGERMQRRLAETSRFVSAVCQRGGMQRYAPGFAKTVHVRIMHAQVRKFIRESGRWDGEAWGAPINQHDMVAATLLFSSAFVEGLRILGFVVTAEEAEAYLQLWRYNGYVMGVESELLPSSAREAQRLSSCIDITQGPPDEDSYTLIRALLESGPDRSASARAQREAYLRREVGYTLMRSMLGDTRADALRIPSRATRHLVPAIRRGLSTVEHLSSWIPGQRARSVAAGQRYWARVTTTPPPR